MLCITRYPRESLRFNGRETLTVLDVDNGFVSFEWRDGTFVTMHSGKLGDHFNFGPKIKVVVIDVMGQSKTKLGLVCDPSVRIQREKAV